MTSQIAHCRTTRNQAFDSVKQVIDMENPNRHAYSAVSTAEPTSLIRPLNKGLGNINGELALAEIPRLGWRLLAEDLSLPTAVLYEDRLAHNLEWMQRFVSAYGAKLAPHGKTTMAPKLFLRQLQAGAWGITLATAAQTRAAYDHGVRRVLMANQLVGKQNMMTIARLLEDPEFKFYCLVDSAEHVQQLGKFFQSHGQQLNVLLEVGVEGGRTGIRNDGQLQDLMEALEQWKEHLLLCGVELFEGVLNDEGAIRAFLKRSIEIAADLARKKRFHRNPIILSGAGSAWYDVVAESFSQAGLESPVDIILRPGCYVTHDVGVYREPQRRIMKGNSVAKQMGSSLLPALQLWAYVQSVPEANKAIIGLGKRDAAFDSGLPTPALHFRVGQSAPQPTPEDWKLTRMMDQHAFLEINPGADIRVGDMVAFDISHPCLTFDKWRYLPVLDADYRVIDLVETFF